VATYRYRAATAGGQLKTGVLEGNSRADAIERVKRLGLMPIETVETKSKSEGGDAPKLRLNTPTRRGIVNAIGELSVLLNAGLPLDRALAVCVENLTRPAVKITFVKLRDRVRHGASLARAMQESNGAFSPMAAAMAEAGEASGKLDESLAHDLTRVSIERLPQIAASLHTSIRLTNLEQASATPIPLHEGAAQYYRERELRR